MKKNEANKISELPNGGLTDETVEAVMLSGGDEMLENKLIAELEREKADLKSKNEAQTHTVTDFSSLPEDLVFSKNAIYKLFNRTTKSEFVISGADLERRLGQDETLYKKIKARKIKAFCLENNIITFQFANIK